jgi:hypothetical protein
MGFLGFGRIDFSGFKTLIINVLNLKKSILPNPINPKNPNSDL